MYLVHEYKRLFIGDKSQDFWDQFTDSIAHIEDSPSVRAYGNTSYIRKFWDLISSVIYFRWHPGLLSLLTSVNCEWSLQSIKISEIQLSDVLALWAVPHWGIFVEATGQERPSGKDLIEAYKKDPAFLKKSKANYEFFGTNSLRYKDPMLVKKVKEGYFLLDGNRRLTRVAWENEPMYKDHWVPTFLLQSVLTGCSELPSRVQRKGAAGLLAGWIDNSGPAYKVVEFLIQEYFKHSIDMEWVKV
jgi:hypothetical protein